MEKFEFKPDTELQSRLMSDAFSDKSLEADMQDFRMAMDRAYTTQNGELCIPGMEGIFMRTLNVIYNLFQQSYNYYTSFIIQFEALFKNDWILMANRYIKLLEDNPPEPEPFSGLICLRATKQKAEAHRSCLKAVVQFLNNLDKEIISSDRNMITRNMQNVVHYLETNGCTVDLRKPSKSKASTRFYYGDIGRLGTAGYGVEPMLFLMGMKRGLNEAADLYKQITNTNKVEAAIKKMEQEIKRLEGQATNDNAQAQIVERCNNIRSRFAAFRGILRASTDMFQTSLLSDYVVPLRNLGEIAGIREDLLTWIFSVSDN